MKMTKNRKKIYNILKNSMVPLSAKEIYDILKSDNEDVWLSTVYRNLEVFKENGLLVVTKFPGQDIARYILSEDKHRHYAICLSCKEIIDNLPCPMDDYEKELEKDNFKIIDHKFVVYGYCKNCQKEV